jgi:hypothetical protein
MLGSAGLRRKANVEFPLSIDTAVERYSVT